MSRVKGVGLRVKGLGFRVPIIYDTSIKQLPADNKNTVRVFIGGGGGGAFNIRGKR